ncbi:MAG: hypothetical protein ABIO24_04530, partial [Saprospiraceae bacterium]
VAVIVAVAATGKVAVMVTAADPAAVATAAVEQAVVVIAAAEQAAAVTVAAAAEQAAAVVIVAAVAADADRISIQNAPKFIFPGKRVEAAFQIFNGAFDFCLLKILSCAVHLQPISPK